MRDRAASDGVKAPAVDLPSMVRVTSLLRDLPSYLVNLLRLVRRTLQRERYERVRSLLGLAITVTIFSNYCQLIS